LANLEPVLQKVGVETDAARRFENAEAAGERTIRLANMRAEPEGVAGRRAQAAPAYHIGMLNTPTKAIVLALEGSVRHR